MKVCEHCNEAVSACEVTGEELCAGCTAKAIVNTLSYCGIGAAANLAAIIEELQYEHGRLSMAITVQPDMAAMGRVMAGFDALIAETEARHA